MASSMNSSGPICPRAPSPPPMSCPSICTTGPLKPPWRTKTRSLIPTIGAATRPGDRKPGRLWLSGHGMGAWSWDTRSPLNRCARRNVRLLFHHRTNPRLQLFLPPRDLLLLPPRRPGKLAALPAQTFPSNRMGHCVALLEARSCRMNTAERPMAA